MKRKNVYETDAGRVAKEGNEFRVYTFPKATNGKPHRKRFDAMEEAKARAYLDEITAKYKSGGEWFAGADTKTMNDALDLVVDRGKQRKHQDTSQYADENRINLHLRSGLGRYKLTDFRTSQMKIVEEWFNKFAHDTSPSQSHLDHLWSLTKRALGLGFKKWIRGPNPAIEFSDEIELPEGTQTERNPLTYDELTALAKVAFGWIDPQTQKHQGGRTHAEHELTYRARRLFVLFGIFLGLRPGEAGGLCWDCVNFKDHRINIRRTVRKGVIVEGTKTSTPKYPNRGKRLEPMSPILDAELLAHYDYMKSLGREVEGRNPILVTERADVLRPGAIGDSWDQLAKKVPGFLDSNKKNKHVYYSLRHTCFNLWANVEIGLEWTHRWGGHTDIKITERQYYHETSDHYPGLFKEVVAWMRELKLDGDRFDRLDCLGYALFRRWKELGIEVQCSPPQSADTPVPMLGYDAMKLLPGPTTIDVVANTAASEAPSDDGDTLEALRARQLKRAQKMSAQGMTKKQIGKKLGVDIGRSTISDLMRTVPEPKWMRKTTDAERAALAEQCHQLRDENPKASSTWIANKLGVRPSWVVKCEYRRGRPMPHRPGDHKLGKYDALIRQRVADDWGLQRITDEINGLPENEENNKRYARSGIAYYINRHKLREDAKPKHRTSGVNLDQYADQIRKMVADRKYLEEIVRELNKVDKVSRSGIAGYLARHGLQCVSGRAQK